MPRVSNVNLDELVSSIKKHVAEIVKEYGIAKPSANVWNIISNSLDNKISPKALYTFVKCNRHNIQNQIGLIQEHTTEGRSSGSIDDDNSSISGEFHDRRSLETYKAESDSNSHADKIEFKIIIDSETWHHDMEPQTVVYRGRHEEILKRRTWTKVMEKEIVRSTKSKCCWIFKRSRVFSSGPKYFVVEGRCKECGAKFRGKCLSKPEHLNADVIIECVIENIDEDAHTGKSKRPLTGDERLTIASTLADGLPSSIWRRKEANKTMVLGDPEPRTLYSLEVLRKAKQETKNINETNQLSRVTDPVANLQQMKHSLPYAGTIRDISYDKFFVQYWSESQLHVYNTFCKEEISCLTIDATGSLIQKLHRPYGKKSGHIFLYIGVIHMGKHSGQVPVIQMLSEKHDINTINFWLAEWVRSGACIPRITVCDFSMALLGACARAFVSTDLKTYIATCFDLVASNEFRRTHGLPKCFIRVDFAHFMKSISQWPCLKGKSKRVKEFYLRSMALLVTSDSLVYSSEILKALIVVALSETEGNNENGEKIKAEKSKLMLKEQISGQKIVELESLICDESSIKTTQMCEWENKETEITEKTQNSLNSWITKIIEESQVDAAVEEGDRDNLHYLPDMVPNIRRVAKTITLWSSLMVPVFQYGKPTASSAIVESYFADLKKRSMKNENLPIRVDKFVRKHYSDIEGNLKIAAAGYSSQKKTCKTEEYIISDCITKKDNTPKRKESEDEGDADKAHNEIESDDEMKYMETWRGLNLKPPKKMRTSRYLSPCSEILQADEKVGKQIKLGLLMNGNLNYKPTEIEKNKPKVVVTNTCAFDATYQCLAAAYCDSSSFRESVDRLSDANENIYLIKNIAKGIDQKTYFLRAKLLRNIFPSDQLKSNTLEINCQCNVTFIVQRCLLQITSGVETISSCNVPGCPNKATSSIPIPFLPIDPQVLESGGIEELQSAINYNHLEKKSNCSSLIADFLPCPGRISHTFELYGCLSVEIFYLQEFLQNQAYPLHSFPVTLTVKSVSYILRAIVGFIPGATKSCMGHYIAYTKRQDSTWEVYDDLSQRVQVVSSSSEVIPHIIFYTL